MTSKPFDWFISISAPNQPRSILPYLVSVFNNFIYWTYIYNWIYCFWLKHEILIFHMLIVIAILTQEKSLYMYFKRFKKAKYSLKFAYFITTGKESEIENKITYYWQLPYLNFGGIPCKARTVFGPRYRLNLLRNSHHWQDLTDLVMECQTFATGSLSVDRMFFSD